MNTDKAQRLQGKVIKFGTKQLKKPTPEIAKNFFRGSVLALALWGAMKLCFEFSPEVVLFADKLENFIPLAIWIITRFFGWDYELQHDQRH